MSNLRRLRRLLLVATTGLIATAAALVLTATAAEACGGFFCQNSPVDQAGERIVFSVNGDGTITSLIEISYEGSAEDFSWILPVPSAISADDLAVPDEGDEVFDELHQLTDVTIIRPDRPRCARGSLFGDDDDFATATEDSGGVEVFASGEVGPFGFDVIGSEDPTALVGWLEDNNYRVEPPMVPLIDVYVEEKFAFVAMRLLDGETSDSIAPIEITYTADQPAIPLRLTAVAATDDMPIYTWIFAEHQAVPQNYDHMEIATGEITLFTGGGNNYQTLVDGRADAFDGRAFITEFAGPSSSVEFANPYLQDKARRYPYVTRLAASISPDEMTVDPVFSLDPDRADVSNVRDASELNGLFDCERAGEDGGMISYNLSDAMDPMGEDGEIAAAPAPPPAEQDLLLTAIIMTVIAVTLVSTGFVLSFRKAAKANQVVAVDDADLEESLSTE